MSEISCGHKLLEDPEICVHNSWTRNCVHRSCSAICGHRSSSRWEVDLMLEPKVIWTDDFRIYMGPKGGPIPRGVKVRLYAKVFIGWWRMGFFEWPIGSGEKWFAPIRCLWRCRS